MARDPSVVLALIDIEHGSIDHIVLFNSHDGCLISIIGSSDFGPFDTSYEKLQWMLRALRTDPGLHAS